MTLHMRRDMLYRNELTEKPKPGDISDIELESVSSTGPYTGSRTLYVREGRMSFSNFTSYGSASENLKKSIIQYDIRTR